MLDKSFKRAVRLASTVDGTWTDESKEEVDEQDPVLCIDESKAGDSMTHSPFSV
jgi:hypothetical protein